MKRRCRTALAVSFLFLTSLTLGVEPAGATPKPAEPDAWTSTPNTPFVSLTPVDDVAAVVGDLGRTRYSDSYYDLALTEDRAAVDLYMNDISAADQLIAEAHRNLDPAAQEVFIAVHQAKYERSVLHAASDEILRRARDFSAQGVDIFGISTRYDGSGLTVDTSSPEKAADLVRTTGTGEVAPEDVSFVYVSEGAAPASRYDDYPPYAGGVVLNVGGVHNLCTSGFGMRLTNGAGAIATAGHCAPAGRTIYDGGGQIVGSVNSARFPSRDAEIIPAATWSGVYTEGEQYVSYKNFAYSYVNQLVCQSGYSSNKICSLAIMDDDFSYTTTTDFGEYWLVYAVKTEPLFCPTCVAVAGGDSGGPVWAPATDGVQSRGINTAGYGGVIGYGYNGNPQYHIGLFSETGWILQYYSAALLIS